MLALVRHEPILEPLSQNPGTVWGCEQFSNDSFDQVEQNPVVLSHPGQCRPLSLGFADDRHAQAVKRANGDASNRFSPQTCANPFLHLVPCISCERQEQ